MTDAIVIKISYGGSYLFAAAQPPVMHHAAANALSKLASRMASLDQYHYSRTRLTINLSRVTHLVSEGTADSGYQRLFCSSPYVGTLEALNVIGMKHKFANILRRRHRFTGIICRHCRPMFKSGIEGSGGR